MTRDAVVVAVALNTRRIAGEQIAPRHKEATA